MVATNHATIALTNAGYEVFLFCEKIITDDEKHLFDIDSEHMVECGSVQDSKNSERLISLLQKHQIECFITHAHYYLPIIKLFPVIKKVCRIPVILNEHHYFFIPL